MLALSEAHALSRARAFSCVRSTFVVSVNVHWIATVVWVERNSSAVGFDAHDTVLQLQGRYDLGTDLPAGQGGGRSGARPAGEVVLE
jgi:hypothetical protein